MPFKMNEQTIDRHGINLRENVFIIKKYARSEKIYSENNSENVNSSENSEIAKEKWILYDEANAEEIKLVISKASQFTLQKDNLILENFSLLVGSENMRVVAKGDSLLFLCKAQNKNRKFRLQFGEENGQNGIEQCQACLELLCNYVHIKVQNSQDGSRAKLSTPSSAAKAMLNSKENSHGDGMYDFNSVRMEEAIASCLLDVNFPTFVNRVEECLQQLI